MTGTDRIVFFCSHHLLFSPVMYFGFYLRLPVMLTYSRFSERKKAKDKQYIYLIVWKTLCQYNWQNKVHLQKQSKVKRRRRFSFFILFTHELYKRIKKMTRKIFYGLWNIMKTYWLLINLLTKSILTCSFWWFLNRRGEILFFLKKIEKEFFVFSLYPSLRSIDCFCNHQEWGKKNYERKKAREKVTQKMSLFLLHLFSFIALIRGYI
jgi:hypothetical protein